MLDLDGRMFGRRREMTQLRDAVDEVGRAGGGCVLLSGPPGVGKSTLTQAFGFEITGRNCVFAYGRCGEGASAPYAALAEALRAIVHAMESTGPSERDSWRSDLLSGTSALSAVLGQLVPELTELFGDGSQLTDLDAADARRRLHRAAIRLISDTASYRTVVLAIDDLQWADRDTLLLLAELLSVSPRNVLVLGAHRAGEFDATAAGLDSTSLRSIELTALSHDDVQEMLATICGRTVELGDVTTEFQHRTGGNPLQIRQLLYRAQREGALLPSEADGHSSWDLRILSSIEVTATAAEFLGRYLDQLRPVDRQALASLACIGREFDLDDAAAAAALPTAVVAQALWAGLEFRLVEAVDGNGRRITNAISRDARYRFSHDRVAEAARADLSDDAKREVHRRIARRLVQLGDSRLFEAARHISAGGTGLADDAERIRFVQLLHRAAGKARAQASFPLALEYSRTGLRLLGGRRWDADFALARELQLGAAEAAVLVGDVTALHELLDEAEEFLSEPVDRVRLAYLRLKGRVGENRIQDAIDIGLHALDEFGEPLPHHPGTPRLGVELVRMKMKMSRWSNERLLALPDCDDPRVIQLLRILAEMHSLSYIGRPNLLPLIVRKQLDLTLAHGHTPSLPVVLASYGLVLVLAGDRDGAQRFGDVAMQLVERPEFKEVRPHTLFLYFDFIDHWRHPIRESLGPLRDAITEALDQGDQEYAGWLTATLLGQSFWAGRPLGEIDVLARSLVPQIRSQPNPRKICSAIQQFGFNMMGRSEDPYLVAGESGYDEREALPAALAEGDEVTLSAIATQRLGLYYWSGDFAGALEGAADEAIEHIDGMAGTAFMQIIYLTESLSRIRAAPKDRNTKASVARALRKHRAWAADSPANYAAPYALIQGAWASARGRHGQSERHLHRAIALAEEHRLPLISAAAHEEAAELYAKTGRPQLHEHMLRLAYTQFLRQGMTLRTDRLAREYPWLISRDLVPEGAAFDPAQAHQVFRTLSAARTPESLANIVLGSVADTTGASRVIGLTGEDEQLTVRALYENGKTTTIEGPWPNVPYDRELVRRVVDSGAPVIVAADTVGVGGALYGRVGHDRQAQSTLVVPVRVQDKTIGVIYAEHHEPRKRFTAAHEEAVAFLCAQAAAPLWNLQLEAQLRAADEYRRSLIDVQSKFVPNELLRILDIDDLRRVRSGYRVERRMTVMISDIRGYTTMLEDMDVSEASDLAMGFLRAVEVPIVSSNGMIQDVRGDEIVAVFESEADAVRAGLGMLRSLREHNHDRLAHGSDELHAGIGLNTGALGIGLVGGVNRMVLTIIGDAVNLAARIESTNKRYGSGLLISDKTYRGLPNPDEFDIRRMERVMVVNRRHPVTIYEVYADDPDELRAAKRSAQPAFDEAFALFDAGDVDGARAAFERCQHLLPDDPVASLHLAHCDAMTRGEMSPGQEVALLQK
ncbi:AAA family ATPase [Mycobacterium sp. ITM-2016-00318]|uniref:AAA family ATPase n=1 Tax=Mycobacterium sp. ITM-2016-00318 TaxID=2099693 RepID=UPI0018EC245A